MILNPCRAILFFFCFFQFLSVHHLLQVPNALKILRQNVAKAFLCDGILETHQEDPSEYQIHMDSSLGTLI